MKHQSFNRSKGDLATIEFPPAGSMGDHQLKEAYSRLQISYEQSIRDKREAEESLRAETLANEEQRNYIEILKQALESKMDTLGVQEIFGSFAGERSVDIYAEMSHVKKSADDY